MQRKLAAILCADVAGYSGLMEADEAGTLARLKRNRAQVFDPCVTTHGGRVVKLMGDGALVEFASVVAALDCAVAIQQRTAETESAGAHDKLIAYRIGINLGDVIVDADDMYGTGVNVAARVQALAPIGGIAISGTVRDHVVGKIPYAFEDMGEHAVKNLEQPVRVFVLRPAASAQPAARATAAPRQASICVLPFANMSGDPEQEYFSDGISEDIITDLSKVSALSVVARNTAFTFKGRDVSVPQVAGELGVSHVLAGSVRKAAGRVRITAQLVDGAAGDQIWADRYDRDLTDIFALQDEIAEAIVQALKLKLLPGEKAAIERHGTHDVEAYNLYLMARRYWLSGNQGDTRDYEAIVRLCERATQIDPGYAQAWVLLASGKTTLASAFQQAGDDGAEAIERALALDPNLAEAHALKARLLAVAGRHDEAAAEVDIALRLDPDSFEVNFRAGANSYQQLKLDDAIRYLEKATALADSNFSAPMMLLSCYAALGDRENARKTATLTLGRAEKAVARDQNNSHAMACAVNALAVLGEIERAKDWIDRALLIDPGNKLMRYNFACALTAHLGDEEAALGMLGALLEQDAAFCLEDAKVDPDLDGLRDDPRFQAMIAAAESRLRGA